jgi:hypothetical protein
LNLNQKNKTLIHNLQHTLSKRDGAVLLPTPANQQPEEIPPDADYPNMTAALPLLHAVERNWSGPPRCRCCPSPPPLPSSVATCDGAPTPPVPTASAPSTAGRNCPLHRRSQPPPPPPVATASARFNFCKSLLRHRFNFCKSPSFVKQRDLELEYREVVHLHRQQLLTSSVVVSPGLGMCLVVGSSPRKQHQFLRNKLQRDPHSSDVLVWVVPIGQVGGLDPHVSSRCWWVRDPHGRWVGVGWGWTHMGVGWGWGGAGPTW